MSTNKKQYTNDERIEHRNSVKRGRRWIEERVHYIDKGRVRFNEEMFAEAGRQGIANPIGYLSEAIKGSLEVADKYLAELDRQVADLIEEKASNMRSVHRSEIEISAFFEGIATFAGERYMWRTRAKAIENKSVAPVEDIL